MPHQPLKAALIAFCETVPTQKHLMYGDGGW